MPTPSLFLPRQSLQTLLQDLLGRARQEPHPGSLPLSIGGKRCGWLFPAAAKALAGIPDVIISATEAHIGPILVRGPRLNELLAEAANALRAAGCAPGWRNELLDVWSDAVPDVTCLGVIERGVVRPLGLVTRAVHLNAWSGDNHLWVARRALSKATDPGMWDTLVGGLIASQEPPDLALVRESDEEAGLEPDDISQRTPLRTITRMLRQVREGYQAEDVLTCECVLAPHVTPCNRDGEVMDIQRLPPETVLGMLLEGAFTIEASIVITQDLLARAVG